MSSECSKPRGPSTLATLNGTVYAREVFEDRRGGGSNLYAAGTLTNRRRDGGALRCQVGTTSLVGRRIPR